MRYTFRTDRPITYNLCENDTFRSVAQNISILLSTRCGTIPMYREYGIPMRFLDKPIPIYEAIFTEEITEALERFEPRAKLISVSYDHTYSSEGKSIAILEVEIEP